MKKNFSDLKIMVVARNDQSMRRLRGIVKGIGINNLEVAGSVKDALKKLEHFRPDIVIAENHPSTDGIELSQRTRVSENINRYVPIILIAEQPDIQTVRKAIGTGVNEILAEPIAPDTLSLRLSFVMNRPRSFVSAADYCGPSRRRRKAVVKHRRRSEDWETAAVREGIFGSV